MPYKETNRAEINDVMVEWDNEQQAFILKVLFIVLHRLYIGTCLADQVLAIPLFSRSRDHQLSKVGKQISLHFAWFDFTDFKRLHWLQEVSLSFNYLTKNFAINLHSYLWDFEPSSTPNLCGPTNRANYKIHPYQKTKELHKSYIFPWWKDTSGLV